MIFPSASLKHSSRTRARKNAQSEDMDVACPPLRSSVLARLKTRPPPLQIIPESSENELDFDVIHSPATARPMHFTPPSELVSTRVTLSAYTFSIDDALLMFGNDTPRSPALSASSSTTDGTSSEGVPATPEASDDDDGYDYTIHTPRLRPQHIPIRPLCITKTRSLICQEDEDIHNFFEEEEKVVPHLVTEETPKYSTEAEATTEAAHEAEQDFYIREFQDFISFPTTPAPSSPARRDSLILVAEVLSVVKIPEPKPRGRSRHSKPLPSPPATPPAASLPSIPTFSLVQTTAQKSAVRRKRNMPATPSYPPPPPIVSRPLPRIAVPLDVEDSIMLEKTFDVPSRRSVVIEQVHDVEEDTSVYSRRSFISAVCHGAHPLPPAIPETPLVGMYGEVTLPRSSTDSDAPRSSIDSTTSLTSSTSSDDPISTFSFPSSPFSEERLRSRWSSSTLGSVIIETPRSTTLLSPLRNVFGARSRRVLPSRKVLPHLTPSKFAKNKHDSSTTPSPPSTPPKHVRQQGSQSSTSSAGPSSSERDSHEGSPSGWKRKPIPVAMFLRATS